MYKFILFVLFFKDVTLENDAIIHNDDNYNINRFNKTTQLTEYEKDIQDIKHLETESKLDNDSNDNDYDFENVENFELRVPKLKLDTIIIDCSPINFVDSIGVKTIQQVI